MSEQNKISFTVSSIPAKKNHAIDGMIALKKIEHFSYALSDEIGLGYSSHVYKGKNDKTTIDELVAVKVIDIKKEDELHRQFTNDQVNILQKIKNTSPQNLLRLEGVFKTKNNLYIITEFCEGKDVAKILRKKKLFNQSEAQGIMKQFLKGYGQLYKLKVVHRDLKLANIFIAKGRAVLADFGFAIDADRCLEKFDYNVGSPFYMPPQSLKFNRYSYKSDVWAIGIIAFELIYGHRPWKDKDDDILFEKITNTRIDQLFQQNVSVSENYKNFIRECLKIDFDRRASPEFVINYEWNQAADYIGGLDQPLQYQNRNVSIPKMTHNVHPASTKHTTYKAIQFEDIRQNKMIKNQEAPFSLMPARQFSPHKEHIQLRKKNNSSDFIMQQNQAKNQGSYQYESLLKKRNQRQNTIDYLPKQVHNQSDIQKAIVSQIQYCRFLNLIYDEISALGLQKFKQLQAQICKKIIQKMDFLSRMQHEQQNQVIPGIKKYTLNPRWRTLSQMITDYKKKYNAKFLSLQSRQNLSIDSVSKAIMLLRSRVHQFELLLELIAYLYQVLQLQNSKDIVQFSKQSRIEYLAQHRNITQSPANTERLIKKLQYLGF